MQSPAPLFSAPAPLFSDTASFLQAMSKLEFLVPLDQSKPASTAASEVQVDPKLPDIPFVDRSIKFQISSEDASIDVNLKNVCANCCQNDRPCWMKDYLRAIAEGVHCDSCGIKKSNWCDCEQ